MALKDILKELGRKGEKLTELRESGIFVTEEELKGVRVLLSRPGTLGEIEVRDGNGGKTRKIVHLSGRG